MTAPLMMTVLDRPAHADELANFAQLLHGGYLDGQPIPSTYGQLWQRAAEQQPRPTGRIRFIAWRLRVAARQRGTRGARAIRNASDGLPFARPMRAYTNGVISAGKDLS
ncbi:hypothetical protein PBI_FLOOF_57 [Microbacterium phage Floof]|uniref:Uncharacterized protein n=1 Tax=Microbacterium phage Floof TaxID=2201433 RepID=A0A2Z4Q5Z8_9CAUD|nr:hypothetical protein PBI_FLOOF_57 [Microbacterium phage Floof]